MDLCHYLPTKAVLGDVLGCHPFAKEWQLRVEETSHRLALAEEIVARDLNRVPTDLHFVAALPEVKRAPKMTNDRFWMLQQSSRTLCRARKRTRRFVWLVVMEWKLRELTSAR